MIRRLLVPFAVLALMVMSALPASASGANTQTTNFHGAFSMPVGPLCAAPAGILSGTENAVMHVTVNGAGDFWFTATQEAWFTLVPFDSSLPTLSGHFAIWFGGSFNNQNAVAHDIFNVKATGSDGSTLNINLVDHMSISASGQVNAFSTGCS